ncbi:LPS assembly lipoprotein LptE [Ensifer adhaerens]|uniref:LPS assembly lipoprotein LptE n=1 Tax=Ensifer adhaerens TaxID=106592 RepID=UPI00098EEA6E|nr:LPS assembly lipoprotein LptE [Ensifer adhaerens]
MSLSDRAGFRIRSIPVLAGVLMLTALAGCQVRPLYSDPVGTSTALAAIEISEADDRVEQEVRNALIFLAAGGQGEPVNPQYHLALNVTHRSMGVLYDQAKDRAGAGRIVVKADYNLTKIGTGETIKSGNRTAVALVDFPVQEFAKVRAVRDGENRAAKELAELIRADIAAALSR